MDSTRQIIPLLILVIASTISIFSCAPEPTPVIPTTPPANLPPGATGWQQRWEQTLALAKEEGEVLVYATMPLDVRTGVTKAMRVKYGINLIWVAGSPSELARRVIEEKSRGIHIADAIVAGGGTMLNILKPEGLMAPLGPLLILPEVKDDDKVWKAGQIPYHDEDGTGVGLLSVFTRYVLVNTNMVKKDEVTSYYDLLKPRYKGQIVFQDPTVTGQGLTWTAHLKRIWGLEQTKDYLRQLARQEPIIIRPTRQGVEWVARGKYPVGLGQDKSQAVDLIEAGAPLAFPLVREKGKLSPGSTVFGVFPRPGHPNAVTILLNWLLSQEGQTILYKAYAMPSSRADIKEEGISPTFYPQPGEEFLLGIEEEILKLPEMIALNREIFGIK